MVSIIPQPSLSSGKETLIMTEYETVWTAQPVWMWLQKRKYHPIQSNPICIHYILTELPLFISRAVAQAVSRWLPTAAARVRFRAGCGVCGGQCGTGAGFLRVLRFPLPIIPQISPSS
jgi:hypothetical protein